ncbi:MAG: NADPH-dependent glutamate synthase [Candidatus Izemoplasma sp.]|nr:NADPH-dependent glutamate synthase [Candidatus Izemoplasma sp.]
MKNRPEMPTQDPKERIKNFDEVPLGLTKTQVILEANRCLQCKRPLCVKACPVSIRIPEFIDYLAKEAWDDAYDILYEDNVLPSICGRVCPQEKQCEGACILGKKYTPIAIGMLERYLGDYGLHHTKTQDIKDNGIKVAVVGSGPAGLSNAYSMRKKGYDVTIYEALHAFGGVLQYGIPSFRLPKSIVKEEIDKLKAMGVHFEKNTIIGKTITIEQLFDDTKVEAIFIGSGAGLPRRLNIPGENHSGVYYANEFLTRVNLMKSNTFPNHSTPIKVGDNVAVIGGGNVAMDAARTAKRLGAKNVFILYRRDMSSLPARQEEIEHAKEEGITFNLLLNPVEFKGDNYIVNEVVCEVMTLGEKDASGRHRPVGTKSYKTLSIDSAIVSIGQSPNPILSRTTKNLKTDQWGRIETNNYETSIPGVFAGGDVVSGAATVILAMGAGKEASLAMDSYIQSKSIDKTPKN